MKKMLSVFVACGALFALGALPANAALTDSREVNPGMVSVYAGDVGVSSAGGEDNSNIQILRSKMAAGVLSPEEQLQMADLLNRGSFSIANPMMGAAGNFLTFAGPQRMSGCLSSTAWDHKSLGFLSFAAACAFVTLVLIWVLLVLLIMMLTRQVWGSKKGSGSAKRQE